MQHSEMSTTPNNVGVTASNNQTMSSSGSSNNNSNGGGNSSNNNNNNNNNEQPQTKRQRIEKTKSSKSGKTINKTPPPDLIDTVEITAETINKKSLCSSLSSSANSISTPSCSSNNSPTSTPASSRATSLSQLLNVQSIANILPTTVSTVVVADCSIASGSNSGSSSSSSSSSSEQSADEVDRVVTSHKIPDLLLPNNEIKTQQQVPSSSHNVIPPPPHNSTATAAAARVFGSSEESSPSSSINEMREFEESLTRQCLCGVSERTLRKPFQSHYSQDANGTKRIANLCEWPTNKLLQFLSNLQLLFDIYLKQNSKGFICARIMDVCDVLIRNDHNLIDEIIVLAGYSNSYVQFLAGRVLASFLVIAKQEMDDDWLKKLVDNLFNFERLNHVAVQKIHFSLEIIKRIVEWKDVDLHPLEDEIELETRGNAGISAAAPALETQHLTEAHSYMHFQTQQPTLENNYFAVHFRNDDHHHHTEDAAVAAEDEDDHAVVVDDDDDSSNDGHIAHSLRNRNMQQHYAAAASTSTLMPFHQMDERNFHHHHSATLHNFQHQQATSTQYQTHFDQFSQIPQQFSNISASTTAPTAQPSNESSSTCHIITLTDSESFDTTHLKCITIKILENKWPALVKNMSALIASHLDIENAENCILNFLQLWENIISVKANLSIVETLPFYAQLDKFELLLNQSLSCTIYKQMLCLFNEALCYGSTLALQDMLPDETCLLAHQIVRHVKDFRILESLPRRQPENIVSLIGFKRKPVVYEELATSLHPEIQQTPNHLAAGDAIEMDKTILQKMVLLVLKSIAVTVKEIRSDSSDSSIDSTDYDAFQDMVLIERSIRDVLRKLESFIKNTLEFHPECHFSKILIHLFDDQDDHLIEAMVCTLDVTSGISFRNNAFPELLSMLNPVYTFLEFLKMISNSSDLLLDLLVSNETCFLLYLLRFLKYVRMNWALFVQSCHDFGMGGNTLDEGMSVLIRLRLQISRLVSRQLYPYDISPVLRLLESCESLYEGNELS